MSIIYALSSGVGRAGVAVIRLSGPGVAQVLEAMAGPIPDARRASLRRLRTQTGETLDHGVVLWFPAPGSFTGEDCAELQVHGSRAVVTAVLDELSRMKDCRPALPGEFARRAFVNGRADLIELEALGDLIDAETDAQRRMALRHAAGGLRVRVDDWSEQLSQILAMTEADLDFSDEDDVVIDLTPVRVSAERLALEIEDAVKVAARSEAMREGFHVAIIGPPNAGKSSLLNRLAGHDAAIVSDLPGTTRDTIQVRLDLGGMPACLIDTAGLRETSDVIERLGVERARAAADRADLALWLAVEESPPKGFQGLAVASQRDRFGCEALPMWADLGVSIGDARAIERLLERLRTAAVERLSPDASLIVNARQRALLQSAARWCGVAATHHEGEMFAEALRCARHDLALVSGRIAAGDVLDHIFSRFCIGK